MIVKSRLVGNEKQLLLCCEALKIDSKTPCLSDEDLVHASLIVATEDIIKRDFKAAVIIMKHCLQRLSQMSDARTRFVAQAHAKLASCYLQEGDSLSGENESLKTLKILASFVPARGEEIYRAELLNQIYWNLVVAYSAQRRFDEAMAMLAKVTSQAANQRQFLALNQLAGHFMQQNNYKKASILFDQLVNDSEIALNKKVQAQYMLSAAECYACCGDVGKVQRTLERATAVWKTCAENTPQDYLEIKARILLSKHDLNGADKCCEKLLSMCKNDARKSNLNLFRDWATSHRLAGNLAKAESILEQVILLGRTTDNKNPELQAAAMCELGQTYRDHKRPDKTIELYSKELKLIHEDNDFKIILLVQLGATYADMKEYDRAIPVLNQAISLSKSRERTDQQADALSLLARAYSCSHRFEQGAAEFAKSAELLDNRPAAIEQWTFAFRCCRECNNLVEAERIGRKVLHDFQPDSTNRAFYVKIAEELALLLAAEKRFGDADEVFRQAYEAAGPDTKLAGSIMLQWREATGRNRAHRSR